MSEWRECKLGDVAKLSKKSWKVGDEQMPYIGLEHIEEAKLRLNGIGKSDDVASNKFRFQAGDTLFGKLRPYFRKVVKPDFDGICSTDIWVINPQKGIDKDFIFYFFANKELVDISYSASGGTRMPRADWDFLAQTIWNIPPLEEQKAIAEVLSSLDDKIDLLHRQNKTLEEMAQTLFRQWFVEEADEGWEVGTLNDIMQFNPTHSLKKGEIHPFLEMGNVQTFKSCVADWYKRAFTSGTKFKNGDTLLARITPSLENGKTAYVDFLEGDEIGWGSTEFIVMRMKDGFHPFISYLVARNEDFREFAIGNMTGSTGRQRAQAKDIKEYEIAIPPIEIIPKLNESIKHIPIKIRANSKQIKTLENMRDTLLPKLMSREVRVKYGS